MGAGFSIPTNPPYLWDDKQARLEDQQVIAGKLQATTGIEALAWGNQIDPTYLSLFKAKPTQTGIPFLVTGKCVPQFQRLHLVIIIFTIWAFIPASFQEAQGMVSASLPSSLLFSQQLSD